MPHKHTITIINGCYACGKCTLSDHGETNAHKDDDIIWELSTSEENNVAAITSITKKKGDEIFQKCPAPDSKKWKAKIKSEVSDEENYYYTIHWTGKDGKHYTHDPKIAVRPSSDLFTLIMKIIKLFLIAFSGLFAVTAYRRYKR